MRDEVFSEKLRKAFEIDKTRIAVYDIDDIRPVDIEVFESIGLRKLKKAGFVIVDISTDSHFKTLPPHKVPIDFGIRIGLGNPYVPIQYTPVEVEKFYVERVNKIVAGDTETHSNFFSTKGQLIHTDGTLDSFNAVPTALLYCKRPALKGGENTVYNVVAALHDLYQTHPNLVYALFKKHALCKFSPSNPTLAPVVDGAMGFDDNGRIITRYSDSEEFCKWSDDEDVQKAVKAMRQIFISQSEPKRWVQFRLQENQILLLANNQVAHGRESFTDHREKPREVWRALFIVDIGLRASYSSL